MVPPRRSAALAVLLFSSAFACGSSDTGPPAAPVSVDGGDPGADAGADSGEEIPIGGDRPVTVHVPPGYAPGVAAPLVILLHGYSVSGQVQEVYFGLTKLADARGFLYAYPDGTVDATNKRFWNATDACCDLGGAKVDDSAYLSSLITQIQSRYSVDPKRVFLVGHSNGGFMSYRMACDHGDRIAAIASLAGATFADDARCAAKTPVNVLQIHGTADGTIAFAGGAIAGNTYPSAEKTVSTWAAINGCGSTPDTSAPNLDLDSKLAGEESKVTRYTGCKPGGHAELWTIEGGAHIPTLSATFSASVVDFLFAHPKP